MHRRVETILGLTRMLRFLAIVLLIAAPLLGAGGHASFASTSVSGGETALTALDSSRTAGDRGDTDKQVPSQRCHYLGCSHGFERPALVAPFRTDGRSALGPPADESDRRSIILKRDPPIPRSPI